MGSGTTERWYVLCQLASVEQDSDKLIALIKEINRLLDEKEQRLKQKCTGPGAASPGSAKRAASSMTDPMCALLFRRPMPV